MTALERAATTSGAWFYFGRRDQVPHKEYTIMRNYVAYFGLAAIIIVAYLMIVQYPSTPVGAQPPTTTATSTQPLAPVAPDGGMSIYGKPTISVVHINAILDFYGSPARGQGQALYDLGVKYGIDPVFALAFFANESTFGTRGEATATLALGNLRCINDRPCVDQDRGGYAQFYSWQDGFAAWYALLDGPLYRGAGLTTVETIIPRYAPNADHNNEAHYIGVVEHLVATWRAGKVQAL